MVAVNPSIEKEVRDANHRWNHNSRELQKGNKSCQNLTSFELH